MRDKITRWAEALHFPLWIAKDAAWFFGLGWISLTLALPVIALSVIVTWSNRGLARWEWSLLTLWLIANTVWMGSERLGFPHDWAVGAWSLSLSVLPLYLFYLRKHFKKQ
jgi:hypothetical protein